MYTRAYPPRTAPIPQNYGGIAMREAQELPTAEEKEERISPPLADVAEEESPPTPPLTEQANEEDGVHTAPEAIATSVTGEKPSEKEKLPIALPTADLLLIALAVLLLQGEKQDNELLIALLFLLLYN